MVTPRRASLAVLCFLATFGAVRADQGLLGFSDERARAQRALEQRFDASLRASDLRDWMRRLSARPHHLGSPYGKENAEFIASLFRSWGYDTRIEEFRVLFPTPRIRLLEMSSPRASRPRSPSRGSRKTPPRGRPRSSFPSTTRTRSTATSPRLSST
jgi:N-acetylated-alpha-linked acidic dipeptidase